MNKTALITGASSGIGLELARIFAREKADVILVARSEGRLTGLAEELRRSGIRADVLAKDLSLPGAAAEIAAWCAQQGISVDYLVNNAGFGDYGPFADSDWDRQRQMIELNITALTHLTRLFVGGMIARGSGRILNVASTAAFQPGPLMSVYYATKAYVLHFSEAIANELEGSGVTVTTLCPGPTESGFVEAADLGESRLVKGRKLPSSARVAEYGYRAMMRGKKVAIEGALNYIMANSVRFVPRALVLKIARGVQDKAK